MRYIFNNTSSLPNTISNMQSFTFCTYRPRSHHMTIHASKLAACAGLNPYETQDGLKSEFRGCATREQLALLEIEQLPLDVKERVDAVKNEVFADANAVVGAIAKIVANDNLSAAVVDQVTKDVFCKHGTEQEGGIRKRASPKAVCCERYRATREPILTCSCDDDVPFEVYVGGKHDGLLPDGTIVEIKTRQYRFLGVREYERVQVHAYMMIYGTRLGRLIESHNGVTKEHDVPFDDVFWSGVLERVRGFVVDLIEDN